MKFTVLGASGFIGSNFIKYLQKIGEEFFAPKKNDNSIFSEELGNVIYCIGLTADFREKPFETIEAHVCLLSKILKEAKYDTFTYLSSCRVYINSEKGSEDAILKVDPSNPDDLYNLSKLTGEALCLSSGRAKVVRLSNVLSNSSELPESFIKYIVDQAKKNKKVILNTSLDSEKDYIHIDDVVSMLHKISKYGSFSIYNLASGKNITNLEIIQKMREHFAFDIEVLPNVKKIVFPQINITKIKKEFDFNPIPILNIINEKLFQEL